MEKSEGALDFDSPVDCKNLVCSLSESKSRVHRPSPIEEAARHEVGSLDLLVFLIFHLTIKHLTARLASEPLILPT